MSVKGPNKNVSPKPKGVKDPNDASRPLPKVKFSDIRITDVDDLDPEEGSMEPFLSDPLMSNAIEMLRSGAASAGASGGVGRHGKVTMSGNELDIESQLKMMDFFTSAPGSTEDLVGARRAVSLEALPHEDPNAILQQIDRLVEQERLQYMDLPPTDLVTIDEMNQDATTGSTRIPPNQLAHGDWYVSLRFSCNIPAVYFRTQICLKLNRASSCILSVFVFLIP
jgi:hypothetical protein